MPGSGTTSLTVDTAPVQQNWKPGRFGDSLSEIIASGDIQQARDYFDKIFWEKREDRPAWKHLRLAILKEDLSMIRLLATWGAHPTEDEMSQFRAVTGEKYGKYVRLMRQGGLRSNGQPWTEIIPAVGVKDTEEDLIVKSLIDHTFKDYSVDKIPREWLQVLNTFQAAGSPEAVIAGGAMRDLFNDRKIKDVDIFLRSQGSEKKNRKFLKAVFEASGVEVHAQEFSYNDGYGTSTRQEVFPSPNSETDNKFTGDSLKRERQLESWKVIAGAGKTEYNIIFVSDNLDQHLMKDSSARDAKSLFVGGLLGAFDTGLSQIATDGKEIVSTEEYKDDVRRKRITVTRPDYTTVDHLNRIAAKYPDFEQSKEMKEILAPKPPPPPRNRSSRSYGGSWY